MKIRNISKILTGLLLLLLFGCKKSTDLKYANPVAVFDEVWKVLDQRYAFFAINSVDWNSSYNEYRPQVTDDMTDDDLFRLISDMLEMLKDGHVSLISSFNTYTYENFYTSYPRNFNYTNVINNYLENDYKTSGPLIYKIYNQIGYIYYSSFKNDVSDQQIDKVLNEMNATNGLILDVRDNKGGKLVNADRLFRRFLSERKLVKYEISKNGAAHNDLSDPVPYYLSPGGTYYNRPICVLTNRACFSACNDFALYMSGLSNATLIGDQTGGGGSIPITYTLANGWKLQYSSTITLSPEEVAIESGIPPGINIGITPLDESRGKDPILERAFLLLQ